MRFKRSAFMMFFITFATLRMQHRFMHRKRVKTSVLISIETSHFFQGYERVVPGCSVPCEYRKNARDTADALWYHAPASCGIEPKRARTSQKTVIMSMESAAYYSCLDDKEYMSKFDIRMTYRLDSNIPLPYLRRDHLERMFEEPVPFAQKKDAIVYLQSNCGALSNRDDVVRGLMDRNITVESRGRCLNNAPPIPFNESKVEAFKHYKFCACMDNSVSHDYISEKLWDCYAAGCLPIYLGAPNVDGLVPSNDSFLDARIEIDELVDIIRDLMKDEISYNDFFAWKRKKLRSFTEGFQRLVADTKLSHSQCRLCELIARG